MDLFSILQSEGIERALSRGLKPEQWKETLSPRLLELQEQTLLTVPQEIRNELLELIDARKLKGREHLVPYINQLRGRSE